MKLLKILLALSLISNANAIESLGYFEGYPTIDTKELSDLSIQDYVNFNEEKCIRNSAEKKYIDVLISTGKVKEVLILGPSTVKSELKEASIKGTIVNFKIQGTQEYKKYNVPVLVQVRKIQSEARPISAAFIGLFTLGILPILSPKEFAQHTVGCSDITAANFVYDANNKRETNVIENIPAESYESKFVIKGLGKEFQSDPSDVYFSIFNANDPFDLEDTLTKRDVKEVKEVIISCISCVNSNAEYKLTANFEELKQALVKRLKDQELAEKRKEIEIENKQKEAAAKYQREKEAKEQLVKNLKEKEQSTKILKAKERCVALGYPTGSDKLNKCVLQLLE